MTVPGRTPVPNPSVVATRLATGETVLLDIDTGNYISLNATAALIWSGIEDGKTLSAIRAGLIEKFDVTEERATYSLARFVDELAAAGLVQALGEGPE